MDHDNYSDAYLREVLTSAKTIALVGASLKPERASHRVMKYLLEQGYQVIPVNPGHAGRQLHDQEIVASLDDIDGKIDLVDVFRNSDAAGGVADEAIAIGAGGVWMQLGVRDDTAAKRAEAAGLKVVMDRCPKIEIPRLGLEHG